MDEALLEAAVEKLGVPALEKVDEKAKLEELEGPA